MANRTLACYEMLLRASDLVGFLERTEICLYNNGTQFHKWQRIPLLAERLSASKEGVCSMELVRNKPCKLICCILTMVSHPFPRTL